MVELIPAILPKTFRDVEEGLMRLQGLARVVQIDLTAPGILAGQELMPLWEEFDFEFDLMFEHPEREVLHLVDIGAARIIIHERNEGALDALQLVQDKRDGSLPLLVGIALRAHDTPDVLQPLAHLYDYVQVMGIDHEGRQGEPPDLHGKEIELIRALREQFPDLIIQVDGAVAPHIHELVQAGANRLVVGSALTRAENPKAVYKALYTEANR